MDQNQTQTKAKLQLAASMLIFGTIGLFVRSIALPSSVISLVRGLIGSLFLFLLAALSRRQIAWADIRRNGLILLFSGACLGFNWILLFEAYRYTTVATATLMYYFAPVIVILFSVFFLKEKLTLLKGICALMAFIGMVLVSGLLEKGSGGRQDLTGILFGLGAAILYACVTLLSKQLKGISGQDVSIVQLAVSAIVLLPYTVLTGAFSGAELDARSVIFLLLVAVIHTGVAYALYFASMSRLWAQTIAIYSYIDPLVAVLVSALILREDIGQLTIIGGLLILGSTLSSELIDQAQTSLRQ